MQYWSSLNSRWDDSLIGKCDLSRAVPAALYSWLASMYQGSKRIYQPQMDTSGGPCWYCKRYDTHQYILFYSKQTEKDIFDINNLSIDKLSETIFSSAFEEKRPMNTDMV